MAATFSLIDDGPSPRERVPLAVAAVGPFGERTAEHLTKAVPGARLVAASDIVNAFAVARDAVVIALWRPEPGLCELADEVAHRYATPWLPVTMDHPVIRVGPLVLPGCGPCFRCYQRRRQQHDTQPAASAALIAAYAANAAEGPAGYLPHHARIAAGMVSEMLRGIAGGGERRVHGHVPGSVTTIRLFGRGITTNLVVQCHDCLRCGGSPGPVGELETVLSRFRSMTMRPPGQQDPLAIGRVQ
jgi:bacteriocin biosynthesis cyclodehydratase domain-containing protein